jgi:hypothetical protein
MAGKFPARLDAITFVALAFIVLWKRFYRRWKTR